MFEQIRHFCTGCFDKFIISALVENQNSALDAQDKVTISALLAITSALDAQDKVTISEWITTDNHTAISALDAGTNGCILRRHSPVSDLTLRPEGGLSH